MFDIGMGELALIGLLALIVLGPKRLPEVARTAGLWVGRVRRFVASVKEDFDRELRTEELTDLRKLQQELTETRELIQRSSTETLEGLEGRLDADPLGDVVDKQPKRKSPSRARTAKRKKAAARTTRAKKPATRKKDGRARKPRSR
ncbi:MAG: Sec-independent protein translocase protein TatB [Acidiferrobacterales bacterium]